MSNNNQASNSLLLYYKIKAKVYWMMENIKYFIALFFFFLASFYIYGEVYLRKQFYIKVNEVAKNIIFTIETYEAEVEQTLISNAITVQEKMLNNPKLSSSDLIVLSNQLGVSSIGILNGTTGKYELSSSNKFDKNNSFYKELSLFDVRQCETQECNGKPCRKGHEVQNCKLKRFEVLKAKQSPEASYLLPMMQVTLHSNNSIKAPAKWILVYNKKLNKIIDIFYTKEEIKIIIENILNNNRSILSYLKLTDNNENLIMETGRSDSNNIKVKTPFEKEWNFNIEGEDIKYSYILHTEFDTTNLKKEIFTLRILFGIIIIFAIITLFTFSEIVKSRERGVKVLS